MPSEKRPSWCPSRLTWFPGERPEETFSIREASSGDIRMLVKLSHLAGSRFTRKDVAGILSSNDRLCYVVARNARTIVGFIYARLTPFGVRIRTLYVCPAYRGRKIEACLLLLASLELPEADTLFTVPALTAADYPSDLFLGWKRTFNADETITYARCHFTLSPPDTGGESGA